MMGHAHQPHELPQETTIIKKRPNKLEKTMKRVLHVVWLDGRSFDVLHYNPIKSNSIKMANHQFLEK